MDDPDNTVRLRLSDEQKMILHQFMDQNPKLKQASFSPDFTHHSAQRLWIKISAKLNSVPGARKKWSQWRKTWQDLKKNSRKSGLQVYATEKVPQDTVFSEVFSDADNSKDSTPKVGVKRLQSKSMSRMQKTLLCKLVKSNNKLNGSNIYSSVSFEVKHNEWKKIAEKLNSTVGPQKTWTQWKRCWLDIRKHYIQNGDEIEKAYNSSAEETFDVPLDETTNCRTNDIVSAAQINCMVKEMSQRSEAQTMLPYIWLSLCTKLNKIGPLSKSTLEWRKVWTDYKLNVKKLVSRYGFDQCNHLQQWTYKLITQESDRDLKRPIEAALTENRLQIPNDIAECNIIGSLVAVKLRSMRKEQKLISEKLISEILFQGQMEMYQYSDKVVSIPGYT